MTTWSHEIKDLERLHESFKGQLPKLEKELGQLIHIDDPNVILLYSRRCLEVIITDLCECELKRPRKTEPLKGIIDKLNKEEKVPSNIITSMDHLNGLSAYGAHPKDFDPEQVKPVLNNLDIIVKWYLKYKDSYVTGKITEVKPEPKQQSITPPEKSIIVLPFINMSADPEQEYFCDGMTEEIINALTHIKDLRVIARTSSFAFKNKDIDIHEIGEKLNVGTLLEGSVRKSGDQLRITAQLINVQDNSHLWSERYDRTMKDIFDIQDEISLSIVDILKIKLMGSEEKAIVRHYTDNPELYNLYLLGLHHANKWTPEDFIKSEEYFDQAIRQDPNYALAYVGIAEVYVFNTFFMNIKPKEAAQKAEIYLKTALRLEKNLAEAHSILGHLHVFYDWDWDKADEEFKSALDLNPNSVLSLRDYSNFLAISGQHERAIQMAKQARDLDPLSLNINSVVGERLVQAGHSDEAIDHLKQTIAMEPHWYFPYSLLGIAYYAKSKFKEATEAQEKCYELSGRIPFGAVNLACVYYAQGKNQQGDVIFNEMKQIAKKEYVSPSLFSAVYFVRGEMDEAYKWWKKACDDRDFMLPFFSSFKDPNNFWMIPDEKRFHDSIDRIRKSK